MSSPENMRTGRSFGASPENYLPETFFIIYLILASILRRCGYKDGILYAQHSKTGLSSDIFDSGVMFNLFSEYGVGTNLKPLIVELFTTMGIDPEKNKNNIFFKEIVRLSLGVSRIIREHDNQLETEWMFYYATSMVDTEDEIATERENRLKELLDNKMYNPHYIYNPYQEPIEIFDIDNFELKDIITLDISTNKNVETSYMDEDEESWESSSSTYSSDDDECQCKFCNEFRKYHHPHPDRNVSQIINNTLTDISTQIKT